MDVSPEGNQIETPVTENETDTSPSPTFLANQDPKPSVKKWVSVDGLSDEFDGNGLDANK